MSNRKQASDPTPAPEDGYPDPPDMMHFFEPDFEGGSALDTAMANWARSLNQKTQKALDDVVQDLMRRYGRLVWEAAPASPQAGASDPTPEPGLTDFCPDCDHGLRGGKPCQSCDGTGLKGAPPQAATAPPEPKEQT